jgi:THO complex subunit 2
MFLHKEISAEVVYPLYQTFLQSSDLAKDIFCECLWMLGCDWNKEGAMTQDIHNQYISIIQFLMAKNLITPRVLLERLDESTLAGCSLITDSTLFMRRRVRVQTKLMYEQQKFNLLREESEGFAKVITELTLIELTSSNLPIVFSNIQSLIGFFNLDPNRVLDLILEVFEHHINNPAFIELVQRFNTHALPQILGFKLLPENEVSKASSRSIFKVVAQLLKNNCFSLADIWPYLTPEDEEMKKAYDRKLELAEEWAVNASMIKLDSGQNPQKDKEKDKRELEEMKKQYWNNQKLWLMEALVRVNAWDKVEEMYYFFHDYFDPSMLSPLVQALIDLCHWMIEPLYRKVSFSRFFSGLLPKIAKFPESDTGLARADDYSTFYHSTGKLLKLLNIHVSQDILLYTKLCRTIKASLKAEKEKAMDYSVKEMAEAICSKTLLPALSLTVCNPGICSVLWEVISEFEYIERYNMYNQWLTVAYASNYLLLLQYATSNKDTQKWLKRVSRGNAKQTGKLLAKLSHSNPCILFDFLFMAIKSYENQIQSIITSLTSCTPLALDIIVYVLLRHMSEIDKEKLEPDGGITPWLNNLSSFAGQFFRKYYWADPKSIFHYVCGKLKTGCTEGIVVISEVMTRMTGYSPLELDKMTENQFESMAGGKHLRVVALNFSSDVKRAKTSSHYLAQLFWKKIKKEPAGSKLFSSDNPTIESEPLSLAMTLATLIAQNLQTILYRKDSRQLKFESRVYDRLNSLFMQFSQFLANEAESAEHYEQLLPHNAVVRLVTRHKLAPDTVFHLINPAIKPLYECNEEEYNKIMELAKEVLERYIANLVTSATSKEESQYFNEAEYFSAKLGNLWDTITPEFYGLFWFLKLHDILVPSERYDDEVAKLTKDASLLQKDAKDDKGEGSQSKKKLDRINQIIENLKTEKKEYTENSKRYLSFLESKKHSMLNKLIRPNELSSSFMQYCIFPRLMLSPSDAIYSIKFIGLLFKYKVPYINFLDILEMMLKRLLPAIQCCTENEAYNFGIFFVEVFRLIQYWQDEHVWKSECFKSPGFTFGVDTEDSLSYGDFKDAVNNIHKKVSFIMQKCINSEEYMQVYFWRRTS